ALEAFGLILGRERLAPLAFAVDESLEVLRLHSAGVGTARPKAGLLPAAIVYGDEPSPPLRPGVQHEPALASPLARARHADCLPVLAVQRRVIYYRGKNALLPARKGT